MILVDFSATCVAGIMASQRDMPDMEIDIIRHFILNSLRSYRHKFRVEYDDLVLCCDGGKYWRRQVFPYYKAKRKQNRAASPVDWTKLLHSMDAVKQELKDTFPYPVVELEGVEGDDIIGILSEHLDGKHLVISNDKDMVQLQSENVSIYSPLKASKVGKVKDVRLYLREHILIGDKGDGIPNVLSDDDTLVTPGKRQKPMTKKRLAELLTNLGDDEEINRNYHRNKTLIDLSEVPSDIKNKVISRYDAIAQVPKNRSGLLSYFIKHRLQNLSESLDQF